jgi:hypothetical protein
MDEHRLARAKRGGRLLRRDAPQELALAVRRSRRPAVSRHCAVAQLAAGCAAQSAWPQ